MINELTASGALSEALRSGACCRVSPDRHFCTRGRNHEGQHMAFDSGKLLASWNAQTEPREEADC